MTTDCAYLIPGFLGFGQIGSLAYFSDEKSLGLDDTFRRRGIQVYRLKTLPTASIELRARAVAREILAQEVVGKASTRIHLIGHSTGGLDACELVSRLPDYGGALQGKIASITTIATPHYGTPLADFFDWIGAERLLALAGTIGATIPWSWFSFLTDVPIVRDIRDSGLGILKAVAGLTSTLLEGLVDLVAAAWTAGAGAVLYEYFDRMARHQGALRQLTQSRGPYRFREGIRCFSYLTGAPPTGDGMPLSRALYSLLYRITGQLREDHFPPLPPCMAIAGGIPDLNDGVVPTRSMVWGQCLGYLPGDHMDIIGHPNLLEPINPPSDPMIKHAHEVIADALVSN